MNDNETATLTTTEVHKCRNRIYDLAKHAHDAGAPKQFAWGSAEASETFDEDSAGAFQSLAKDLFSTATRNGADVDECYDLRHEVDRMCEADN